MARRSARDFSSQDGALASGCDAPAPSGGEDIERVFNIRRDVLPGEPQLAGDLHRRVIALRRHREPGMGHHITTTRRQKRVRLGRRHRSLSLLKIGLQPLLKVLNHQSPPLKSAFSPSEVPGGGGRRRVGVGSPSPYGRIVPVHCRAVGHAEQGTGLVRSSARTAAGATSPTSKPRATAPTTSPTKPARTASSYGRHTASRHSGPGTAPPSPTDTQCVAVFSSGATTSSSTAGGTIRGVRWTPPPPSGILGGRCRGRTLRRSEP